MSDLPLVTPRKNYSGPLLVICKVLTGVSKHGRELQIQCERTWADGRIYHNNKIPRRLHHEHYRAAKDALRAFNELNIFNLEELVTGVTVWRYDIHAYHRKLRRLRKERNLVQNAQAIPGKRQGILVPSTSVEDLARTGSLHQADHQPACPPDHPHGPT